MKRVIFTTRSGIIIDFQVFKKDDCWNPVGGVYAFCTLSPNGEHYQVIYVGKGASFYDRIPNHERWAEARAMGASVVLAALVAREGDRQKIEQALIADLNPPLNVHHRLW